MLLVLISLIIIILLIVILKKEYFLGSFEHAAPKGYDFALKHGLTLDGQINYLKYKNEINSYLCKNKIK